MAKKRRRSNTRARATSPARAYLGTAERPGGEQAESRESPAVSGSSARPAASREDRASSRGASSQRSRTEKKELARRQREEIRRRVRRAERTRQLAWIAGITVAIAAAVFLFTRPDEPTTRPDRLPGELADEGPWPANADLAAERVDLIGLPDEGAAMHEHADIQVFAQGEQVAVPVNIGIDEADGIAQSLHTHSDDGLVHIESATVRDFTLGEFFDVWGVRLSATCLGAYCADAEDALRVFKDGEEVTGPIRDVVLDDLSVVVVTYGTQDQIPDPIPTFDFSTIQP